MANDLTRTPLKIDTAGSSMIRSGPVRVRSVRWVGATTAGHQAVIQDSDGRVLWESVAGGANNVEAEDIDRDWPRGFKVPTLGSGTLYIDVTIPVTDH